jgi:hypothetical protein
MNRTLAIELLYECTGDDIWPREYCLQRDVPETWVDELLDGFESGYRSDSQTIYLDKQRVNQFEGIRDVDLACKLGEYLGVNVAQVLASKVSRSAIVRAIREEFEEG